MTLYVKRKVYTFLQEELGYKLMRCRNALGTPGKFYSREEIEKLMQSPYVEVVIE